MTDHGIPPVVTSPDGRTSCYWCAAPLDAALRRMGHAFCSHECLDAWAKDEDSDWLRHPGRCDCDW